MKNLFSSLYTLHVKTVGAKVCDFSDDTDLERVNFLVQALTTRGGQRAPFENCDTKGALQNTNP